MLLRIGDRCPDVDATAWVAPSATVVGSVTVGARASIWYAATLRADHTSITVGERSNIQDGCALHIDTEHALTIGAGVSVGHNAVLHGCTVEDDSLIGMGAVVLNGAVIGAGSLVAAGAVVAQNVVIPPGSLVAGVPGRVRRELSEEERDRLRANAAAYVELAGVHARAEEV